jgi:hypothetical protein
MKSSKAARCEKGRNTSSNMHKRKFGITIVEREEASTT